MNSTSSIAVSYSDPKLIFLIGNVNIEAKVSVAVEYVTCLFLRAQTVPRADTALNVFNLRVVAGEAVGAEEQAAVTITGVSQAAFPDHNVQYQFRTENNGGQVSAECVSYSSDHSFLC